MSVENDLALLRRYEPIIRYTAGESFFPMDVERYVRACSMWVQRPNRLPLRIWPEGLLTLKRLAQSRTDGFGSVYYLKFSEPLPLTEMTAFRLQALRARKDPRDVFKPSSGRLARVGYSSRFVDALFSLSLLARGRVPGDTAAAAIQNYKQMMAEEEKYRYYGRVVRQEGWIALQYWFFYPFNNWRSGFSGANDHEADWEMIYIYLYQDYSDPAHPEGKLCPEWVAYASHDFSGDDLRRRWDDPELEKEGQHPVVYAGAGSHASYFRRGEYLAEIQLPFVAPVVRFVDSLQAFWEQNLRPYQSYSTPSDSGKWSDFSIFRVPFVDYARGDGYAIGPGQERTWAKPGLLDPPPAWASQYRGLWGLYAQDPLSGEDAPAGPMYNRDGTVRRSWYDPLGWAGLDKVPPPHKRLEHIRIQLDELETRRVELKVQIGTKSSELQGLGIDLSAIRGRPHLEQTRDEHHARIKALSDEVDALRAQLAEDDALAEALNLYIQRIERGERGPRRAHIRHAHTPTSAERMRLNRFAEVWAAISVGLMMIGFVLVVLFAQEYRLLSLGVLLSLLVFVEAGFRRRIADLITSVTIGLAILCGLVLIYEFFWEIVIAAVLLSGAYIMWENIRELRQ